MNFSDRVKNIEDYISQNWAGVLIASKQVHNILLPGFDDLRERVEELEETSGVLRNKKIKEELRAAVTVMVQLQKENTRLKFKIEELEKAADAG